MDVEKYSESALEVIENMFAVAVERKHHYVMPEHLLYAMLNNEMFVENYIHCGGNAEKIKRELIRFLNENAGHVDIRVDMEETEGLTTVFEKAEEQAMFSGREKVEIAHIFSAIISLKENYGVYYIVKQGVDILQLVGELSRQSIADEREGSTDEGEKRGGNEEEEVEQRIGWSTVWCSEKAEANDSNSEKNTNRDNKGSYDNTDHIKSTEHGSKKSKRQGKPAWQHYVECVNDICMERNPLIGREKELEMTILILSRMDKNNVIHVGEAGVGKTAIVYGLARMIEEGRVPETLRGAKIFSMDMGTMLAGTQYRGDFEKRFQQIMKGLSELENPILYIDEIHSMMGAGATGEGSLDMSNMLKPYLADGKIKFIGATTYEEYKRYISKSKSILRRFTKVDIPEPTKEETLEILEGLKPRYEKFHCVKYRKDVLEYAIELSSKFMNERFLPDKAIDLIDEAGAYRKLHPILSKSNLSKQSAEDESIQKNEQQACEKSGKKIEEDIELSRAKVQYVGKDLIDDILARICNIPKQKVEKSDIRKLKQLEKNLAGQVFGQDMALSQVSNAVKFARAGLNEENKPIASFLFVGATGVGKTETARALAEELGISFIRFDMSEYAEKHTVAKLIGSPSGYVGYEDGGLLTDAIRKHPHALLLLDEIEKAHSDIYNILLQVMDYATLTDNQGRKADFRNVIIIMTSNAGASSVGKSAIGFAKGRIDDSAIYDAVKNTFQPEFRNRLSKIILFKSMDDDMALKITEKKLGKLQKQMADKNVELIIDKKAVEWIKRRGITAEYGAREIDRVIADSLKPLLVEELLFGRLKKGGKCRAVVRDDALSVEV